MASPSTVRRPVTATLTTVTLIMVMHTAEMLTMVMLTAEMLTTVLLTMARATIARLIMIMTGRLIRRSGARTTATILTN